MQLLCVVFGGFVLAPSVCLATSTVELDSYKPEVDTSRIVFASCSNRRHDPEYGYLKTIDKQKAGAFLWMGDIVYGKTARCTDATHIAANLLHLKQSANYVSVLGSGTVVEGVYDDHDAGCNDANRHTSAQHMFDTCQALVLDFLQVPKNHKRRTRNGMYSAHVFGPMKGSSQRVAGGNPSVLVVFTDTRTHSDGSLAPSVAWTELKLSSFVATFLRWIVAYFGWHKDYSGKVLSEEQWHWLEEVLSTYAPKVDSLLLVSSTQVFTSNPYFESWNHLPSEKRRLISVLRKTLVLNSAVDCESLTVAIVSGDVHHSEFLGTGHTLVEATSSGLTHTVSSSALHRMATMPIIRAHEKHRMNPNDYFTGFNFGMVSFEPAENGRFNGFVEIKNALTGVTEMRAQMASAKQFADAIGDESLALEAKISLYGLEYVILAAPFCALLFVFYFLMSRQMRKPKDDKCD